MRSRIESAVLRAVTWLAGPGEPAAAVALFLTIVAVVLATLEWRLGQ